MFLWNVKVRIQPELYYVIYNLKMMPWFVFVSHICEPWKLNSQKEENPSRFLPAKEFERWQNVNG